MSEYATLKRRPILFPDSVSSFHDSIFSLKEELKALVADDLQNKDAYVQTAVEIAIDLRSALADWTLTKLVDDDTRVAASEDLLAFAEGFGCGEAVKAARQEIESIANSSMRKMGDLYRQGKLNTVWGHDYASGLDHSLRRGARWCTSNPCKIQGYKKDFPEKYASLVEQIKRENPGASTADMASQMFTKVCAISARALAPIYEATNGQYGFVCLQVDPREIRNTQAMIDQVHFWNRAMAKELNIPVICLSQLSRANEKRDDKRPMLSDLRESGAIEQDADIVLFLYRDDYYNEDSEKHNIAECIVAKNRHGETGKVELRWMPEYTTFSTLDTRYDDEDE